MSNLGKEEKKPNAVTRFVGDVLSKEKKIGDLNGKWAVMLKMTILTSTVVAPLILAWVIWVTSNIFATQHHIADTTSFRERIVEVEAEVREIENIQEDYKELKTDVKQSKELNTKEHRDIGKNLNESTQELKLQLTRIQTQLEEIQKKQE